MKKSKENQWCGLFQFGTLQQNLLELQSLAVRPASNKIPMYLKYIPKN